ncbi:SIR2 family protein [Cupriavidus necator]
MGPLATHLRNSDIPAQWDEKDRHGWATFCDRIPHTDLESALTEVTLTERVTSHVVRVTWQFLNEHDIDVFHEVIKNRSILPLSRLFQHLLASTTQTVQVVTPNYDRVAEYAAEGAQFCAYTGFTHGLIGHRAQHSPPKIYIGGRPVRAVNVWKVHGSFGWFSDDRGAVVSLPPMNRIPPGLEPLIVTPGIDKYRRTHGEPFRTIIQSADAAIRDAASFLCVGYGFNDEHLQPLLVQRCEAEGIPLILITKEISATARRYINSGRCRRYLALEECSEGTMAFSNEFPQGMVLPGASFWQLGEFLDLIM